MIDRICSVSGRTHINSRKQAKAEIKTSHSGRVISPKVILPAVVSAVLLSALGFAALLFKRIVDNTKPPKR